MVVKTKQFWVTSFLLLFVTIVSFAQTNKGVVYFEHKSDWVKMLAALPFMTQEEIERDQMVHANRKARSVDYILNFDDQMVQYFKSSENLERYSWSSETYFLQYNTRANLTNDYVELLGKRLNVSDEGINRKWKIHNEIKEVAGYLCMKAETYDSVYQRKVYAWFTDAIPISGGPEGYYGLPGMILQVIMGNGAKVVTAKRVAMGEVKETPSIKERRFKDITRQNYNRKIIDFYNQQVEGKRNPYWQMRY